MIRIHRLLRLRISVLYFVKEWGLSGVKEVECTEGKNKSKNEVHFLSSLLDSLFPCDSRDGDQKLMEDSSGCVKYCHKDYCFQASFQVWLRKRRRPFCPAKIENSETVEHSGPVTDFDHGTVSRGNDKASLSYFKAVISRMGDKSSGGEVGQRFLVTLANGRFVRHCWKISRNTQQAFWESGSWSPRVTA